MIWQNNEVIEAEITDGIAVDFIQNRFVIAIKDQVWTDYERKALKQNPLHIYFGYERICAFFLFENTDSIDTSDLIFTAVKKASNYWNRSSMILKFI